MYSFVCFQVAEVLNAALDRYFPRDAGIRIIAEPGRYFVASAFTLTVNIIAKRIVLRDKQTDDNSKSFITVQSNFQ